MTSASNASTSTYRNLLKAVKVWPLQVKKSIRYKEFITSHIKTTFREPVVGETAAELQTRLSNAELQIESLKRLINDDSMKRVRSIY